MKLYSRIRSPIYIPEYTSTLGCTPANKTNCITEILPLRHGLWTHVASRRHTPTQIYFGGDDEIMLYGGVNYRLKANPDNDVYVPWAGRVVFAPQKGDEDIKMQFYQVYLVSISYCCNVLFVLIDCLLGYRGPVGKEMKRED